MAAVDQLLLCKERVKTIKKQMVMAERLQGEVQTTREVFEPVSVTSLKLLSGVVRIVQLTHSVYLFGVNRCFCCKLHHKDGDGKH